VDTLEIPMIRDPQWERLVLSESRPVLVEFWSTNCAVCQVMEPRLQSVAVEYMDRVVFFRVLVEEEEDLVWAYEVMSTPTFIAFRDSEPVGALAGEVDVTELGNLIEDALAGSP
jgi:thioredoxin-like negative regulator of GroEL